MWLAIAAVSGAASIAGFVAFAHAPASWVAFVTATAAGAILAMLADTMMPEAFEHGHDLTGLVTVAGFLAAFALTKAGG